METFDEYLIKEYTEGFDASRGDKPTLHIATRSNAIFLGDESNLFYWLDKAKEEGVKISIYPLGICLLDWS